MTTSLAGVVAKLRERAELERDSSDWSGECNDFASANYSAGIAAEMNACADELSEVATQIESEHAALVAELLDALEQIGRDTHGFQSTLDHHYEYLDQVEALLRKHGRL